MLNPLLRTANFVYRAFRIQMLAFWFLAPLVQAHDPQVLVDCQRYFEEDKDYSGFIAYMGSVRPNFSEPLSIQNIVNRLKDEGIESSVEESRAERAIIIKPGSEHALSRYAERLQRNYDVKLYWVPSVRHAAHAVVNGDQWEMDAKLVALSTKAFVEALTSPFLDTPTMLHELTHVHTAQLNKEKIMTSFFGEATRTPIKKYPTASLDEIPAIIAELIRAKESMKMLGLTSMEALKEPKNRTQRSLLTSSALNAIVRLDQFVKAFKPAYLEVFDIAERLKTSRLNLKKNSYAGVILRDQTTQTGLRLTQLLSFEPRDIHGDWVADQLFENFTLYHKLDVFLASLRSEFFREVYTNQYRKLMFQINTRKSNDWLLDAALELYDRIDELRIIIGPHYQLSDVN